MSNQMAPVSAVVPPESVVLNQARFSAKTKFELRAEDFTYTLNADGNTRTYQVEYAQLSRDRESLVDRNTWLRNVGLLWVALGGVVTAISFIEAESPRISIWLWIGLACLAWFRLRSIRYVIVPAERCNVLIIDDATGADVLRELEQRRVAVLRRRFDYLSPDEHPENQRNRIQWLRKQGVLDEHEASARLLQLDAISRNLVASRSPEESDGE